ncbi:MAG: zinc ribbon domain-containing protein [Dehalococcoidia bacterium]|nr:zinc ribbon domain-containing protein [Dehalococcoidia bacterium]
MPVYEFACNACKSKVSIFVRSFNSPVDPVCDRCSSTDLRRLISKVAILRPPADANALNKQALFDGVDYNDPRSIAQWTRNLHSQLGDEIGPEMDETLERFERGEGSADDFLPPEHDHGSDFGGGDDD